MSRLPSEDSAKLSRLRNSRSPVPQRLQSFPVSRTAQTPPTRLSIADPDPAAFLLFDRLNSRIITAKFLSIWRIKAMNRRKRRSVFQESLSRPDFDVGPRIETISGAKERLAALKAARSLKSETMLAREAQTVAAVFRKRTLCKMFGKWESEVINGLARYAQRQRREVESQPNARAPDLLGRLHTLIARRAELETELENRQKEIDDISAVLSDNRRQLRDLNERMTEERVENTRVQELREGIDSEYKDQIANLRMMLWDDSVGNTKRIEEAQKRMKLQKRAREITSDTIAESKESLQARLAVLNNKLGSAQAIAVQIRDELLVSEDEQNRVASDVVAMKVEISRLSQECEALKAKRDTSNTTIGDNLETLKSQYQAVMNELKHAKEVIDQYNEQLLDQDSRIDVLSRELALARQRRRTTVDAFSDRELDSHVF